MSVIPATREAEAGELLDPRRWRTAPLHCSLSNRDSLSKEKGKRRKKRGERKGGEGRGGRKAYTHLYTNG